MNPALLAKLRDRRVSLFCFHVPLDDFGKYGNSKTLADALGITIERPFAEYYGALVGVIGTTDCKDVRELKARYAQAVGHETSLYQYGGEKIVNNKVAVVAGGGNDVGVVNELISQEINVLVTGLSLNNKYSSAAHQLEKDNHISLLGGTHYSSEKFGCIAMCNYFIKLGLQPEFIEDAPCFEDL